MDTLVFAAVLLSSFVHALWNSYAKRSKDKLSHFCVLSCAYSFCGICIALFYPFQLFDHFPIIAAGCLFHVLYRILLSYNYEEGDLSFVYPVARGFAPLIVILCSYLFIQEMPNPVQLAGIVIISLCITSFGLFGRGHHSWKAYSLALLTGVCVACYSFFGGWAAREMNNAILAIAYIGMFDGFLYTLIVWFWQPERLRRNITKEIQPGIAGGLVSFFGYMLATWCMKHADMSAVTALRATSVLFAAGLAVWFLKEKMNAVRIVLSLFICIGVILIKL